jgi:hypothetical protein
MSHYKLISVSEIASRSGVSIRTVQRAAAQEMFLSPKQKNHYHRHYFLTPALEKWILRRRRHRKGSSKAYKLWRQRYGSGSVFFPWRSLGRWIRAFKSRVCVEWSVRDAQWMATHPEVKELVKLYNQARLECQERFTPRAFR